jgi:hypothetical protein
MSQVKREGSPMAQKRKYRFIATLVELAELNGVSEQLHVIDEYTFSAVSVRGAKRAASEWYNRAYPDARLPGSSLDWHFLGAIEQNRHYRITPSSLALVLAPSGSQESDEAIEEMMVLISEVRRDPQAAREKYRADDLLAQLECYFRYCVDEVAGEITDQVRRDADMVYDWPGAPAMLSRALGCSPRQLRKLLGQLRDLQCPNCERTFVVLDERRKGGFAVEIYYCVRCQVDLVEYQPPASRLRYWTDWRDTEHESV